MGTGFIHYKKN